MGTEKLCFDNQINTTSSVTNYVIFFFTTKQQMALGSSLATQCFHFC